MNSPVERIASTQVPAMPAQVPPKLAEAFRTEGRLGLPQVFERYDGELLRWHKELLVWFELFRKKSATSSTINITGGTPSGASAVTVFETTQLLRQNTVKFDAGSQVLVRGYDQALDAGATIYEMDAGLAGALDNKDTIISDTVGQRWSRGFRLLSPTLMGTSAPENIAFGLYGQSYIQTGTWKHYIKSTLGWSATGWKLVAGSSGGGGGGGGTGRQQIIHVQTTPIADITIPTNWGVFPQSAIVLDEQGREMITDVRPTANNVRVLFKFPRTFTVIINPP